MDPYTARLPDPRLMARLMIQLRFGDKVGAFKAAGEALAIAILASRGGREMPEWAEPLADYMVGALLLVEDETIDTAPPSERLRLSTAAIVLSVMRPHVSAAVDGAVSLWMGWGMGTPRIADSEVCLLRWTLLRLFLDDVESAAEAVHAMLENRPFGPALVLHDWVVASLQHQGDRRLTQCFGNLRTLLSADPLDSHPSILVLAAVVLNQIGPMRRGQVLGWLDGQLAPPEAARNAS
ncbi:MAG: hypothetical protein H6737_04125 [Alphaproteobacteria bacterium]|nr:hypothetical protein [Alphaproteobacteria bacterium]